MGIELEWLVLLTLHTLGTSVFGVFEVETPWWRLALKWGIMAALTGLVYLWAGHWALVAIVVPAAAGAIFHFRWCRGHGIDPWRGDAAPRVLSVEGLGVARLRSVRVVALVLGPLLSLGAFGGASAQAPEAWLIAGQDPDEYRLRLDTEVARSGASSMRLSARGNRRGSQWAVSVQMVDATGYRGKRVRLGGYVRADDVDSGGLWLRVDGIVDGGYAMLALDNSEDRRVEGTLDWTSRDIVVDVPPEAVTILFGAMIMGDGGLWVDDLSFEEVSEDVALTAAADPLFTEDPYTRPTGVFPAPTNLGFERAADPSR